MVNTAIMPNLKIYNLFKGKNVSTNLDVSTKTPFIFSEFSRKLNPF